MRYETFIDAAMAVLLGFCVLVGGPIVVGILIALIRWGVGA